MPTGAPIATTAIVLCGGRGLRLRGVEKPLAVVGGRPLVDHVIERLRPQVARLALACGDNAPAYSPFGYPVVVDEQPGEGPLGGVVSALAAASTPWVLTTPGDTPFLPRGLVAALSPGCRRHGVAVASAGGRRQNLTLLLDAPRAASLAAFFHAGGRAAHRWLSARDVAQVAFPARAFLNVNTPQTLRAAQRRLARR